LGLEKAPDRRRGPASSSPRWRQDRILKFREGKRPGPLKPKDVRFGGEKDGMRPQSPAVAPVEEKIPDSVREKRNLRDQLAAQLGKLKDDIAQLEYESKRSERLNGYPEPSEETTRNLLCAPC
jgi:hypothetical protein